MESFQQKMKDWKIELELAEIREKEAEAEKERLGEDENKEIEINEGEDSTIKEPEEPMTSAMRVRRWFCFSQMTVHDEAKRG